MSNVGKKQKIIYVDLVGCVRQVFLVCLGQCTSNKSQMQAQSRDKFKGNSVTINSHQVRISQHLIRVVDGKVVYLFEIADQFTKD